MAAHHTSRRNDKGGFHEDGGVKRRKVRLHLGDALSDGLLVDDVDEWLPRLFRRRTPLWGLRRHVAVHAAVGVRRGRRS
jgi:hypothetical protein